MKTKLPKFSLFLLLPAALLAFTSCSSTPGGQPTGGPVSTSGDARGGLVLDTVTGIATVKAVNAVDRTVVLEHPDGSVTTYECGPEVRNFAQIKVGDQVTATAAEELAVVLVPGGVPPVAGTTTAVLRTPLGDKPGGEILHTVAFTAKVLSVDAAHREVNLQLPDGSTKQVKVGPDVDLNHVAAGNDVGVRLTRAFAISVAAPGTDK